MPGAARGLPVPRLDPFPGAVCPRRGLFGCVGTFLEALVTIVSCGHLQRVPCDFVKAAECCAMDFESLWIDAPQAPLADATPWIPVSASLRKVRESLQWVVCTWAWIAIALRLAYRGRPVHVALAGRTASTEALLRLLLGCGGVQGCSGWVSVCFT